MENIYCPQCGKENKIEFKFCFNCAFPLEKLNLTEDIIDPSGMLTDDNQLKERKNKTIFKYISIFFSIIPIIGCFLPWRLLKYGIDIINVESGFDYSSLVVSGFSSGRISLINPCYIIIFLAIISFVFSFIGKNWSIIISIISSSFLLYWIIKQMIEMKTMKLKVSEIINSTDVGYSVGYGTYLILISSILIIGGNILMFFFDKD